MMDLVTAVTNTVERSALSQTIAIIVGGGAIAFFTYIARKISKIAKDVHGATGMVEIVTKHDKFLRSLDMSVGVILDTQKVILHGHVPMVSPVTPRDLTPEEAVTLINNEQDRRAVEKRAEEMKGQQ